ncbi:MAG TPA: tRNA (adenosine(37)-N6)-threonylcarbamoyltransferase complex ATPase subunit type 1 TsaE [Rectinemataceae bacterium]|nr:tRNA (adenosine(37)-N6)-threonylcarbamoyltransferase complex ATPase subunit type 1 TsaE [Rectinemataceae bacterium]
MREFRLHDTQDTLDLGERIGRAATGGSVIALRGGLGAGKTTLAKGVALGLGIDEEVTSPTYTIVSEYEGRLRLHHIDAYRLSGAEEFLALGGDELLSDSGGICLVEWSERIESALPPESSVLELRIEADESRTAVLAGAGLEGALA